MRDFIKNEDPFSFQLFTCKMIDSSALIGYAKACEYDLSFQFGCTTENTGIVTVASGSFHCFIYQMMIRSRNPVGVVDQAVGYRTDQIKFLEIGSVIAFGLKADSGVEVSQVLSCHFLAFCSCITSHHLVRCDDLQVVAQEALFNLFVIRNKLCTVGIVAHLIGGVTADGNKNQYNIGYGSFHHGGYVSGSEDFFNGF